METDRIIKGQGTMSIEQAVCVVFGISLQELKGNSRRRDLVDARRIVVWYYVEHCKRTHRRAGVAVGRVPCSARSLLITFDELCATDKLFAKQVETVLARVKMYHTNEDHLMKYSKIELIGFACLVSKLPIQEVSNMLDLLTIDNTLNLA
jgi:hypothetical protein